MTRNSTLSPGGSQRRQMPIRILLGALVAFAAVASALAFAPSAAAGIYWSSGYVGPSSTPKGVCKFYPVWGTKDIRTDPPTIYARNNTAGSGNDAQWVRFRTFLVDGAGNTTSSNGWSGWALAHDHSPALFSSWQGFTNVPSYSRIDVRIEWWNSTTLLGYVAHRIDTYNYYNGSVGPFGPFSSCA